MNEMNRKLTVKMSAGELLYGTVLTSGSPLVTEMIAQCGYDVLWMDMEHSAIGIESLLTNMMAARSGGTPAWVRVPWNDPVRVKPVIDMGADGVIFPFIRTVEDAKLAVASNKFQAGTEKLINKFFPNIDFVEVCGNREGVPLKPDTALVDMILEKAGVDRSRVAMVGDSGVDIQTARNAGITSVGVSWGFRSVEELKENRADHIVSSVEELRKVLEEF